MKNNTRKLTIAICLLLISAVMLGTSSFAWFSMNTEVNVDGIEVEAYSDSLFLEISTDNSAYNTSVILDDGKQALRLVTQKNLTSGVKITAISLLGDSQEIGGQRYILTLDTTPVQGTTYYGYTYTEVDNLSDGDDVSAYYVLGGEDYELTSDTTYDPSANTTYYSQSFGAIDTDALNDVSGYYETVDSFIADKDVYVKGTASPTADTYAQNNYLLASYNLADDVADLYKNPTITRITTAVKYDAYVSATGTYDSAVSYFAYDNGTYTSLDVSEGFEEGVTDMSNYFILNSAEYYSKGDGANQNVYTKVTHSDGDSLFGYYTIEGTPETAGARYDGESYYYEYSDSSNTYSLVYDLKLADDLTGLYVLVIADLDLTNLVDGDAAKIDVYTEDGDDYVYVGEFDKNANVQGEIYWGRTYSNTLGQVEADNTLNVLKKDFSNYYYNKTLYLRCANNTNDGTNLRIADISVGGKANDLSPAIRVLFVATNGNSETHTFTYSNRDGMPTEGEILFAKILGDEAEVVTVDMYVYFDGMDDAAFTGIADAGLLNGQSIEVKFTIDGPDYN